MSQEHNGLKEALNQKLVENLAEVAELKGELKTSIKSLNERIDRLLALEQRVEKNTLEIGRLKTIWTLIAGFVALLASLAKEYFFHSP
jgi:hypothetical protein